jgi:translation initiation factor IF-3
VRVNNQIRAQKVRVIDKEGNQMGILPLAEALEIARSRNLDLVEVAPLADPPVCRILDYGKYKYQQSKRSQQARRKQRSVQVKEVKMRPKTEEHDYQFKLNHARRFLSAGNKVKVTIMFRGREMAHTDLGRRKLDRFVEELGEIAQVESAPRLEGRNMSMILSPRSQRGQQQGS